MSSISMSVMVNGELISSLYIDKRLKERLLSMGKESGPIDKSRVDFIRLEETGELIDSLLLVQYARSRGLCVEKLNLYKEVRMRRELGEASSYTEQEFVNRIHDEMLIALLLNELALNIGSVEDSKIEEYYDANKQSFSIGEAVWVRHILFEFAEDDAVDKRMRKRALYLLEQIKNGADFTAMAKEFSHCPSASRGGDLGYVYRGALGDAEFEESLFLLKENKPSMVLESSFGYHVVELLGKIDNFVPPFLSIRNRVRDFLIEKVRDERKENLIEELWCKASIEYIGKA